MGTGAGTTEKRGLVSARWRCDSMPSEELLREVTRRIVEAVGPRRVAVFGSGARGELGPNSDLDILVVMPDGAHRRRTAQRVYRCLAGVGFATDVVVATESDIREHGANTASVAAPAVMEGRVIYDAAT